MIAVFQISVIAFGLVSLCGPSTRAQQADSSSTASLQRMRVALQSAQESKIRGDAPLFVPGVKEVWPLGILTIVPPESSGEFVRVRVPVGALISRVSHSIATAQHRRAEKAARAEVAKALAEFHRAQSK